MSVRRTIGDLDCMVVDHPSITDAPRVIVILCHGFGAPGTDLVSIGHEMLAHFGEAMSGVRFVFPAAPIVLESMGGIDSRAWWPLNIERMMASLQLGNFDELKGTVPPQLPEARQQLMTTLASLQSESGLPLSKFVLGGFSQGSMLATDVTLHLPESVGGLCVLSGTLICEDQWRALVPQRRGLPVIQSHGHFDPILPFQGSLWLRDLLQDGGADVKFLEFAGMHEIPAASLAELAKMLTSLQSAEQ